MHTRRTNPSRRGQGVNGQFFPACWGWGHVNSCEFHREAIKAQNEHIPWNSSAPRAREKWFPTSANLLIRSSASLVVSTIPECVSPCVSLPDPKSDKDGPPKERDKPNFSIKTLRAQAIIDIEGFFCEQHRHTRSEWETIEWEAIVQQVYAVCHVRGNVSQRNVG